MDIENVKDTYDSDSVTRFESDTFVDGKSTSLSSTSIRDPVLQDQLKRLDSLENLIHQMRQCLKDAICFVIQGAEHSFVEEQNVSFSEVYRVRVDRVAKSIRIYLRTLKQFIKEFNSIQAVTVVREVERVRIRSGPPPAPARVPLKILLSNVVENVTRSSLREYFRAVSFYSLLEVESGFVLRYRNVFHILLSIGERYSPKIFGVTSISFFALSEMPLLNSSSRFQVYRKCSEISNGILEKLYSNDATFAPLHLNHALNHYTHLFLEPCVCCGALLIFDGSLGLVPPVVFDGDDGIPFHHSCIDLR